MAILNPDHLFEQADKLLSLPSAGPPRQLDLRRAISSRLLWSFHSCRVAAADEFVGVTQRATSRYALVYCGIDHKTLREICNEAKKKTPAGQVHSILSKGRVRPKGAVQPAFVKK